MNRALKYTKHPSNGQKTLFSVSTKFNDCSDFSICDTEFINATGSSKIFGSY